VAIKSNNASQIIATPQGGRSDSGHRRDILARPPHGNRKHHGTHHPATGTQWFPTSAEPRLQRRHSHVLAAACRWIKTGFADQAATISAAMPARAPRWTCASTVCLTSVIATRQTNQEVRRPHIRKARSVITAARSQGVFVDSCRYTCDRHA
jgi:hypothetical protein